MRIRVASLVAAGLLLVVGAIVVRFKPSPTAAVDVPAPAHAVQAPVRPRDSSVALSDSKRKAVLSTWGVLWGGDGDQATFYEATVVDSSIKPEDLGFIRASSLADTTLAIELQGARGGHGAPIVAHLRAALTPDSVARALRSVGCTDGPVVQLRREAPAEQAWELGLAAGAATPVGLQVIADSATMAAEARRLSASIPSDTTSASPQIEPAATLFRSVPFTVPVMYSFVDGATQVFVAVTRRDAMSHVAGADSLPVVEHTMLIGERPAGTHAPLTLVWQRRGVNDEDQLTALTPGIVIRLGRERRATILVDVKIVDGGGGMFLQRVAPADWREVAGSYWGC